MTDLIKQLEAWARKQQEENAIDAFTCDWENGAHQMLALLAPVIEAADDYSKPIGQRSDFAYDRMLDALADLRAKLEGK